jgi:hypothetical protein
MRWFCSTRPAGTRRPSSRWPAQHQLASAAAEGVALGAVLVAVVGDRTARAASWVLMGVVMMADRLTVETGTTGIMSDITKQIALAAVAIYAIIAREPHFSRA